MTGVEATEFLVLLDDDGAEPALAALRAVATVTQVFPPRLAIVAGGPDAAARAAAVPGVVTVQAEATDRLPPGLSSTEQRFVDAWRARRRPKRRRGEGLGWDAAGFTPPDPPPED